MTTQEQNICACGRELIPVLDSTGKQIGVQHITQDDEDHHSGYLTGIKSIVYHPN